MSHFGELTPRMHDFREELLNAKPMVCVERAKITTQTYRENMDQPLAIRRALMYRNVLAGMSIFIEPQTLLAGNQASSNRAAPIFPEYAMDWVIEELDQFDKRDGDRFYITEENKQVLRDIAVRFGDTVLVSLMRQYTPFAMQDWPELDRTITDAEYEEACALFEDLGLSGFFQQDESISESFIPAFDGTGLEDTQI